MSRPFVEVETFIEDIEMRYLDPAPATSGPTQLEQGGVPSLQRESSSSRPLYSLSSAFRSIITTIATTAKDFLTPAGEGGPASPAPSEEEELCPICYDRKPSFSADCGHGFCANCSVRYLREALGDKAQVCGQGVRCPMHSSGCDAFITSTEALKLLSDWHTKKLSQEEETNGMSPLSLQAIAADRTAPATGIWTRVLPPSVSVLIRSWVPTWYNWTEERASQVAQSIGLSQAEAQPPESNLLLSEVRQLHLFEVEASIPEDKRTWCPRCKLILILPEPPPPPSRTRRWLLFLRLASPPSPPELQCCHCSHIWDPRSTAGDSSYNDRATEALVRVTSKACPNPNCNQRISHFHGHACHHISPNGGCPSCHQHFCYVCLRPHGLPGEGYIRNRACVHGSSYCQNRDILRHLVQEPFPHDRRCGCPICPHCNLGKPCEQCDGRCVVCTGVVPKAPDALSAAMVDRVLREENACASTCKKCCSFLSAFCRSVKTNFCLPCRFLFCWPCRLCRFIRDVLMAHLLLTILGGVLGEDRHQ